jgi:hypothetical protein
MEDNTDQARHLNSHERGQCADCLSPQSFNFTRSVMGIIFVRDQRDALQNDGQGSEPAMGKTKRSRVVNASHLETNWVK